MKLSTKNLLYTSIVTGILTVLVLGYFILMLPSLYVDHMAKKNYDAIVEQHKTYLDERTYDDIIVNNFSCISVEIPLYKEEIKISGKAFQVSILPSTEEMKALAQEIKTYINDNVKTQKAADGLNTELPKDMEQKVEKWLKQLKEAAEKVDNVPFDFKIFTKDFYGEEFSGDNGRLHFVSDDTVVFESVATDITNRYTTYVAATMNHDEIVISFLPAMTPDMNEIAPIVINSLPMILAVMILFALVVSYLYSRGIVIPISKLVRHTEAVKGSGIKYYQPMSTNGNDEIAVLSRTLNELYEELSKNYQELEDKNKELQQKNKRQEVFLRSSSHQLKTPIAAALLLVDGMMNKIGKYQDIPSYLPKVKEQLLSMQKMVQDILYLSHCEDNLYKEDLQVSKLISQSLQVHEVEITSLRHRVVTDFKEECKLTTDQNILSSILDSLVSNAVLHSNEGADITINTKKNELLIINSPAHIPEELLPNIFEPFVTNNGSGHGLGLYIVAYYADILGIKVEITNIENGVLTKLIFY